MPEHRRGLLRRSVIQRRHHNVNGQTGNRLENDVATAVPTMCHHHQGSRSQCPYSSKRNSHNGLCLGLSLVLLIVALLGSAAAQDDSDRLGTVYLINSFSFCQIFHLNVHLPQILIPLRVQTQIALLVGQVFVLLKTLDKSFLKGKAKDTLESSLQATKLSRVLFWKDLAKKVVIFFFILIRLKLKIWEGFPKSSINFCLLVSTTCNNLRMPLCVYFSCGYPVPFTPVPSGLLFHCKARK